MIVVTGTKRSGTSMWMQVLVAAGFPFFGERFPGNWQARIGAANPDGFYESGFRRGIFAGNELDPITGQSLVPAQVQAHVVKVFVPGVVRTGLPHLTQVIGSMRPFREYEASRRRMWTMEDDAKRRERADFVPPVRLDPVHEWWTSNYTLIVDAMRRRYPFRLWAYDSMLEEPELIIRETLGWLRQGDLARALAAVKPENRTQRAPADKKLVETAISTVFDELYDMVRRRRPLTHPMVLKLQTVHETLLPRVKADLQRVLAERARRRAAQHGVDDRHDDGHDDGSELRVLGPTDQREKP